MELKAFLDSCSLGQLKEINNDVVGRINALDGGTGFRPPSSRTTAALSAFKSGDLVEFRDKRGVTHRARITSINVKTATCSELATGGKWRVSPSFLRLVGADKKEPDVAFARTPAAAPAAAPAPFVPKVDAAKPTAAHAGGW